MKKKSKNISPQSKIGNNVFISKDSVLIGECIIGDGCVIKNNSYLDTCVLGENVVVQSSTLEHSQIGNNTKVGPYAHLRPNSIVGQNCKIGNFVEIKNSTIGSSSKVSHLAYVGDAQIGTDCNIGCGVVFANYDGKQKHKTIIGDGTFVGSNCTLIAPLNIGERCFLCGGSVVTESVPPNTFVIGRSYQTNKLDRAQKYLKGKNE